jgi:hypothetical protein
MRSRKKKNRILLLIILLLGISIGFAALSTTLKINGTANITKNTWEIYWDEDTIDVKPGSKGNTVPIVSDDTNGAVDTVLTWTVNLDLPGDYYEFTIDAVNDGSIDAMVDEIESTVTPTLPSYIKYSVTYSNGVPVVKNQKFDKKSSETYKIRVEFLNTITPDELNAIPSSGLSYSFTYEIDYAQADENAYSKATTFQADSWDTIKANVTAYPASYPVGSTKTIEMDLNDDGTNETYTLRVVNNSRPDVCDGTNFSQTACGFVVEFQDTIANHRMDYYDYNNVTGSGSTGSWNYSDMRAFVNNGVYAYQNIDYTESGIYEHLPEALRKNIIKTKVLTGHNIVDTSNFESEDKLYLLSSIEVWGGLPVQDGQIIDSLSTDQTRQLDYYRENNVTLTNCTAAMKKNLNGGYALYWLRSPQAIGYWNYIYVTDGDGCWARGPGVGEGGVSPAFRLS